MSGPSFDRSKTLDELDPPAWGAPNLMSHLVTTCHRLRTKRIAEFDEEDLRIMIGQSINLEYLVPIALEALQKDPLVSGDFYEGDLLESVLRVEAAWWAKHPHYVPTVRSLIARLAEAHLASRLRNHPNSLVAEIKAFQAGTAEIAD